LTPELEALARMPLGYDDQAMTKSVAQAKEQFCELVSLAGRGLGIAVARNRDLTLLEKSFGIAIITPRQFLATQPRATSRKLD
jgi:hypothetical protein